MPFLGIRMKTDLFQYCGHCPVFQICWPIECSIVTADYIHSGLYSKDKRQCWPLTHTFVSGGSMGRISLKLFLTHFMIEQISTCFDIDDTTFVSHCGRKQLQMWNWRRERILWVLNWTYQYELIMRFMFLSSIH